MSAGAKWYYDLNGQQVGPISGAELRNLAQTGKLTSDTLVWKGGMDKGVPAYRIKGLILPRPTNGPPPLPTAVPKPAPQPEPFELPADEAPADPVPASPPLIAGLHRQRFVIVLAAGAGMLATFLPWVHAPIIGSVAGTSGDGWITLVMFVPVMVLALWGDKSLAMTVHARIAAGIPAVIAVLIGLDKLHGLSSFKNKADPDNPFAKALGALVQPGIGLYLVVLAGFAVVMVAWRMDRSSGKSTESL